MFGRVWLSAVPPTPMSLRLLASPTFRLAVLGVACLASSALLMRPAPSRPETILDRVYS